MLKKENLLHDFYVNCKEMSLNELHSYISKKDIPQEEISFYVTIYNHFLQKKQKEVIGESYGKNI